MALDFPNAPTDGQIYTDTGSGEQWVYEAATNSWTSKGLVNTTGGLQYKGDIDITAAPPTGATSGSQYSVNPGGTANAGFGPGVTGTVAKGSMLMYTGTGWIETSHAVPDATPAVNGIDTRKWNRTCTVLSLATAGDVVNISAGTAALPGLAVVGDTNSGLFFPSADTIAFAGGGTESMRIDSSKKVWIGDSFSFAGSFVSGSRLKSFTNSAVNTGAVAIECAANSVDHRQHVVFTNTNGAVGSISTSASATAYTTSSDYRLKENVTNVTDGITRLLQLKPSRFNFIAAPGHTVDGFIAHEVQAVVPEAVTGKKDAVDDDGKPVYQGIDHSKVVPLLTAALQEAIGEIESLKARVAAL